MNTINKWIICSLVLLTTLVGCEREFMPPPLVMPEYSWPPSNTTIAEVKARYAHVNTAPIRIEEPLILRTVVTSSDAGGNIYQQIYLEDASGGINFGVAQFSIFNTYAVGQEVFVNLEGLYMVRYGGELQIGYAETNANRISWENFQQHAHMNGWPDGSRAIPQRVDLRNLTDDMVGRLVHVDSVYFVNGGERAFVTNNAATNEPIRNANGNSLDVRTSQYSTFSADRLPIGYGTVIGMLGRFNGSWQLMMRTLADVRNFDGRQPDTGTPVDPTTAVIFEETFGTGEYPSGNRPTINAFTDFDMRAPVVYADATGIADIRSLASVQSGAHVWLPANRSSGLRISGINTVNRTNLVLSYQLAANLFDAGSASNLNVIRVLVNGTAMTIPSIPVTNAEGDNNVFRTVTLTNLPATDNLTIEFVSGGDANTVGFRLDNIRITAQADGSSGGNGGGTPIIIHPNQ